jgi:hypothetical protein
MQLEPKYTTKLTDGYKITSNRQQPYTMTKREIDKYFTDHSVRILDYIQNSLLKYNLTGEDPAYIFTEVYLDVLKNQDKILNEKMLNKGFISTFIYNHTRWSNSAIREMNPLRISKKFETFEPKLDIRTVDNEYIEEPEFDYELLNEVYYQSLKTCEQRAVWEIYFLHQKTSFVRFGKHIGRSNTVGQKYIKWLRKDIKEFYENYQNNLKLGHHTVINK